MRRCNPLVACILSLGAIVLLRAADPASTSDIKTIREHVHRDYTGMLPAEGGAFKFPFITPGSSQYPDILWDWDSWLSNIALRQILEEKASPAEKADALRHEQGCVLNYLNYGGFDGWIPIIIQRSSGTRKELMGQADTYATNMHKPCLAQHAAFLTRINGGDAEWLREGLYHLQAFVNRYKNHQRHAATGLHFWNDDMAIGVDNTPPWRIGRDGAGISQYGGNREHSRSKRAHPTRCCLDRAPCPACSQ